MQVAVIGSGREHEARAEEVGRLLAERGVTVVCGGRQEVMAAAARGAKQAGGRTIGILPGETRADANEWIDHAVVTGFGHGRNLAALPQKVASHFLGAPLRPPRATRRSRWEARGERSRRSPSRSCSAAPWSCSSRAGGSTASAAPRRRRRGGLRHPRARRVK